MLLAFLTLHVSLAAQDVMVTPLVWAASEQEPDELPASEIPLRPMFPRDRKNPSDFGYMTTEIFISEQGNFLGSTQIHGTESAYVEVVMNALPNAKFRAGRRGGASVPTHTRIEAIFNPASAAPDKPDATPRLLSMNLVRDPNRSWEESTRSVPPEEVVWAMVSLDEKGRPVSLKDAPPALKEQLEENIRTWKFAPARRAGQPIAAETRVPFIVVPVKDGGQPGVDEPVCIIERVQPIYPPGQAQSDLHGEVLVSLTVDTKGQVKNPVVVSSFNPAFDEPALAAIRQWRFKPGRRNGVSINARMEIPIQFSLHGEQDGEKSGLDEPPRAFKRAPPLYPFAQRRNGVGGEVLVDFIVDAEGQVKDPSVVRSLNPAFNQPALDAVRQWKFKPGRRNGVPVATHMQVPIAFQIESKPNGGKSGSAIRLNNQSALPPEYRYDIAPKLRNPAQVVYPYSQLRDGKRGWASIRFMVDTEGKVVLGRRDPRHGFGVYSGIICHGGEPRICICAKRGSTDPSPAFLRAGFSSAGRKLGGYYG